MKENLDNNENQQNNDIKEIMKYFNYTVKREIFSKGENFINCTNINKNKINISSIYKEYINNEKNIDNKNEDIIKNMSNDSKYYHEIINKKLNELRNKTISYLDDIKIKIDQNYSFFSENIIQWLKVRDKKITKIISVSESCEQFYKYIKENIFDKIKQIFEIHENIFNSIKDQFTLLNLFLKENNLVKYNCPLEEFILKNSNFILNSWFLSKVNMEPLCLSKFLDNQDLSDLFKNYYSKKKEGIIFKSLYLKNDNKRNYSYEPNISKDNFFKIYKLKLKSMSVDCINKIYKKISKGNDYNAQENYNKIKAISLSNLDLFSSSVEGLSKLNFPILEKLKLKKCLIPYNCQYIFQTFIAKTTNLKVIKIEYVKLTDKSFYDFIFYISNNQSILNTIEYLSFKDNNLNSIDFKNLLENNLKFNKLKVFDLSNNNIYFFSSNNFKIFPNLEILDLTNNNINNNLLFEGIRKCKSKNLIKFIVLLCKNIFLYNIPDNNKRYMIYLKDNLINFNYTIKNINLGLLYNKENREELSNLIFSPIIKLSLMRLNLSYCGLNDICLSNFLKNNLDLISLTNLNISNNFISIKFFSNGNEKNENILLEKIQSIDLSFNNIKYQSNKDLLKLTSFIDKHCYLKKIKLQNNEFINIFKKSNNNEEKRNDLVQLSALCSKRNIKIILPTEFFTEIDNDILKNIFIYKNKYY